MNGLSLLGEFPQTAFAVAFSFCCAFLIGFLCLKLILSVVTREQYNVSDAPRRIRAIVWDGGADAIASPVDGGGSRAAGGPYLLPAAAPRNRFARIPESGAPPAGRVLQLPRRSPAGTAKDGRGNSAGDAA